MMLSRYAQSVEDASELFREAAIVAVSTLETDVVACSELARSQGELSHRISQRSNDGSGVELLQCVESDDAPKKSAGGFALHAGHPIVIANLEREKRFADQKLVESGARSGIVCPVLYQDRKFGTIGVFSRESRSFTQDDVLFLHSLALLMAPALAHRRAEKALADQTKFLSATIDSLESMVLLLNDEGDILRFNQACRSIGGFAVEEVRGRTLWGTFLLPEETSLLHDVFARLKAGEAAVKCESSLLTKLGVRRRISWVFSRLPFKSQRGPSVVASGIDITEQQKALKKLDELVSVNRRSELVASPSAKLNRAPVHSPPAKANRSESRGVEHRAYPRRAYPYKQSIGACRDGHLPSRDDFFEVRCRDISPRGFSYVTDVPPNFFELVVTFGSRPSQLFLQARVVHVSPIVHEGRDCLLVGCEYIQRVELPQ